MNKIIGKNCVMVCDDITHRVYILTGKEAREVSKYIDSLKK